MSTETLEYIVTLAVKIIVAVLATWLAKAVVPWLKEKRIYSKVCKFVKAAEKLGETGVLADGEAKNQYVVKLLEKCGITATDTVLAMIEAAVEELDCAKSQLLEAIIDSTSEMDVDETIDAVDVTTD